jgi:hypothetical protein
VCKQMQITWSQVYFVGRIEKNFQRKVQMLCANGLYFLDDVHIFSGY